MIFAELHGKLKNNQQMSLENSEDLLTSNVFGLLRYLPIESSYFLLFARVRRVHKHDQNTTATMEPGWPNFSGVTHVKTTFWPRDKTFGEPDIILSFSNDAGQPLWVILVEAKLYASKSNQSGDMDSVTEPEAYDPDQLVRYWRYLLTRDEVRKGATPLLVYLTRHSTPPIDELEESFQRHPDMTLGWLSWHDIWAIATKFGESNLPAYDLARLLKHKGFSAFEGFKSKPRTWPSRGGFLKPVQWFKARREWVPPLAKRFWGNA